MSQLKSKLNLFSLCMIAVGACIGSGIFLTPNVVTKNLPDYNWIIIVWILGGVISLMGALTFAELGGMFPKAGGVYVYIREAYGRMSGFLYGWIILLVINTGALAALSLAMIDFLSLLVPISQDLKTFFAAMLIIGLTIVNIFGVHISEWVVNLFTVTKLLAIALIIALAFFGVSQIDIQAVEQLEILQMPKNLMSGILLSLIGVFFSFGGWHHTSFLSEESKNPKRNIPLAMIIGVGIVTAAYVLINMAYMKALPLANIAASNRVAGDALEALIPGAGKWVALLVIISITGTIAIYTMSAPRVYFAMARDGVFFEQLAKVHPRFKTPVNAMLMQAIWAVIILLFWGSFTSIITFVTFMDILFMMLAAMSIFIFRYKLPNADRPIKALLYPIVPAIYGCLTMFFVLNTALQLPWESWAGIGIMVIGIPVFYFFNQKHQNKIHG